MKNIHSYTWRLHSMLWNNAWVNKEIKGEIKKYLETNENEHTKTPNLWDTAKAVLRGKFIAIVAYLKRTENADNCNWTAIKKRKILKRIENFQINNLTLHLQELEEQQQIKTRVSRRKKIIKIRAELNDIETKRTIQRINKPRSCFFEKVNKSQQAFNQTHQEKKREDPNK